MVARACVWTGRGAITRRTQILTGAAREHLVSESRRACRQLWQLFCATVDRALEQMHVDDFGSTEDSRLAGTASGMTPSASEYAKGLVRIMRLFIESPEYEQLPDAPWAARSREIASHRSRDLLVRHMSMLRPVSSDGARRALMDVDLILKCLRELSPTEVVSPLGVELDAFREMLMLPRHSAAEVLDAAGYGVLDAIREYQSDLTKAIARALPSAAA